MTRKDVQNNSDYYLHHTAFKRGYVSRKANLDELPAIEYDGKFGKGYTVDVPSYCSTQYCHVEYYVERGAK